MDTNLPTAVGGGSCTTSGGGGVPCSVAVNSTNIGGICQNTCTHNHGQNQNSNSVCHQQQQQHQHPIDHQRGGGCCQSDPIFMSNNQSNSSQQFNPHVCSRSNDSNPNNSDRGIVSSGGSSANQHAPAASAEDVRVLESRIEKLETSIDGMQKTLQIFQQCLQNTYQLQQRILEQVNLSTSQ